MGQRTGGDGKPDLAMWLAYFRANAAARDSVPWESGEAPLTHAERRCISASIAIFQLGEYAEGRSLFAFATATANELGDESLVAITRCLIREEQNHALMLQRFMQRHRIPTLRRNPVDTVFRRLRKLAGYELSVTVLITAELIALVYYRALRACTASPVLTAICDRILAEEDAHTRYQAELLRYVRNRRIGWRRTAPEALHRLLFAGTVLVVFHGHYRVLRRGGYGFRRFWSECWKVFARAFPPARRAAPIQGSSSAP